MSESELLELKNQIKQEILAEMNTVKKEYENQIKELNKIPNDNHSLEDAIRTIVRAKYGVRSIANINATYEDIKNIVEQILNVLRQNKKEIEV